MEPVEEQPQGSKGFATTEFWMALAVMVVGLVLVITDDLDVDTYWQFAVILGGLYAAGRGLAKFGNK